MTVVGIDFDNTIASYDDLMHEIAIERGLIDSASPKNKKLIRDAIRALPDGESHWRSLQVTVYGDRMPEARLIEGVRDFILECRRRKVPVYIVSHKTEYANFGESKVNLRSVAVQWLDKHGFFSEELGFGRSEVFFESTRAEKIARVKALGATVFIDDLEETFREEEFPIGVRKILFGVHDAPADLDGVAAFGRWDEIRQHLFGAPAAETVGRLVGKPIVALTRTGVGGNSKVYRAECADGSRYAAKLYYQRTMDGLDRLQVESTAFSWLGERGETSVPRVIAADPTAQVGVYEYIEGSPIDARSLTATDIRQLVDFAARLNRLAAGGEGDALPRAAEACFTLRALHESVARRLDRLRTTEASAFVEGELVPALAEVAGALRREVGEARWNAELPRHAWTLSPSDFGFHNALRRDDGSIVFLDFEYFGFDDPAKLIADLTLHPAMNLSAEIQQTLVRALLDSFDDPGLPERLARMYPFFGLKWCAIMLNEFVPSDLKRRQFAIDAGGQDRDLVRKRQLEKARAMFARVMSEQPEFLTERIDR